MNRYMGLSVRTVILILSAAAAIAGCAPKPAAPTQEAPLPTPEVASGPDATALLQDRCTTCHNLDRVTAERTTKEAWERIVTEMIGKGAKLSAEEKTILVEYLAANYGG